MPGHRSTTKIIAGAALALALTFTAQAQNNRSFVATTGNDTNNCSASAYCRTFGKALSQTNSGGEIVVVNSGGYGPATINQPVNITAIGIDASITATTGNALTINTAGNVTITGLNLHGQKTASVGVKVQQVGVLRLYNMLIESFTTDGVELEVAGNLAIYGSAINDNVLDGLFLSNASANAYVQQTSFNNNFVAVQVFAGQATVVDSSAEHSGSTAFLSNSPGALVLFNDRAAFNGTALLANGGAIDFADCLIAQNADAYNNASSTLAGTSPGTSLIAPGQSSSGTLGVLTLK